MRCISVKVFLYYIDLIDKKNMETLFFKHSNHIYYMIYIYLHLNLLCSKFLYLWTKQNSYYQFAWSFEKMIFVKKWDNDVIAESVSPPSS